MPDYPVITNSRQVVEIAASQTGKALDGGGGGAKGDYLAEITIIPATSAAGAVTFQDGSGSEISIFAGGGTTALQDLKPLSVRIGAFSTGGPWKITTGTNVSVIARGNFT
jgi:hypothetical protein